ncbi:MAG: HAMP domain-containing protein, partial [Proteobacteria bacterium]
MKRRLFWKILFAFWITFFAITQGLWLMFQLNRQDRPGPERFLSEEVGPTVVVAGADRIRIAGAEGFAELVRQMPVNQRGRITLEAGQAAPPVPTRRDGSTVEIGAVAPDGQMYRVSYNYGPDNPINRDPFNVPLELIVLGLVGGLLFSAVLAWYLTEPINRLRAGFDRLARGELDTRLGPSIGKRRDEIADLGHDFDLMAQRLQQLVMARDRLLHDVSHELRSPLARQQLAIGLARQNPERMEATLERIDREAQRLDSLVGELLALARVENGQEISDDYFDLADVIDSVADDARFEAQANSIGIMVQKGVPDEEQRPLLRGNAELVRRAMENIVRNALRFSSAGQQVMLHICFDDRQNVYLVDISDQGPGI